VTQGAAVALSGISHAFGAARVIDDVSLDIAAGSFVALLGPSGCGKSTLLRILAGLQRQSAGTVQIDGQAVDGLTPRQRGIGIVFQSYALFPHLTVLDNVTYGLEAQGIKRRAARDRAMEMMAMMRIVPFADRLPRALSGGQQQRVALARTLAVGPRILLLDEPLAALDKNLRLDMQIEIRRLQRDLAITTIMVTHDQEEAMSMADRVAVLNAGRLEQFGTPADIYDRPDSLFVAGFVGTANILAAELVQHGDAFALVLPGGTLPITAPTPAQAPGPVQVAIRPEHWDSAPGGTLPAIVALAMPLGPATLIDLVLADGTAIKLTLPRSAAALPEPGQTMTLRLRPGAPIRVFH
jgi:putative spermidine/putrescine transport system ATP-binding protein